MIRYIFYCLCFLTLCACHTRGHVKPATPTTTTIAAQPIELAHPVGATQSVQAEFRIELGGTRKVALSAMGLFLVGAGVLFGISPRLSVLAFGGAAGSLATYLAAALLTLSIPWLPWVLLCLAIALLAFGIYELRKHARALKVLAGSVDSTAWPAFTGRLGGLINRVRARVLTVKK